MTRKIMPSVFLTCCFVLLLSQYATAGIVGSKHDFASSGVGTNPSQFGNGNLYVNSVSPANKIKQVCVFCHTPHGASQDPNYGFGAGAPNALWNRVLTSRVGGHTLGTPFTVYSSLTSSFVGKAPTGLTLMCLSCHDGVTAIAVGDPSLGTNVLLNAPGSGNPKVVADVGIYTAIGDIYWKDGPQGAGPNIGNLSPGAPYNAYSIDLSDDHPVSFAWSDTTGIADIKLPTDGRLRLFGATQRMECSTCHDVHSNANPPFLVMSNDNSGMCLNCHSK